MCVAEKNGSTSLENDNMCYVSFRIREQETRSTPPKASGGDGDGDGERHSTRNPLIKPIQPENNEKQRKKERSAAATAAMVMAIDGS